MIKRFLSNIDLFGTPVAINFFGREKAKTSFGGVCSLLFFIFVGWALYNGSRDFFSTDNPTIMSYESYTEDPKEMILSSEIFPLAFAVRAPSALSYELYSSDRIYKMNLFHTLLERIPDENGTIEEKWTETKVALEKCTPEYFGDLALSFSDLSLDLIHCIAKVQPELEKIVIQGAFASSIYQTLTLEVSECNNATSEVPCAPQEVLDTYLSGGWFSALYTNMVVNPKDYKHPNSRYRDLYYTMFSPSNYKETEIELGNVQISTDAGWLVENIETKTYLRVNKVTEFLQFVPHPEKVLISCIFQPSKLENFYSRSYKKIQEVLAEVGGLANAILVSVFFIAAPFLKIKFREAMMNELFDIQISPELSRKKSTKNYLKQKNIETETIKDEDMKNKVKILKKRNKKKRALTIFQTNKQQLDISDSRTPSSVITSFVQLRLKLQNLKNQSRDSILLQTPTTKNEKGEEKLLQPETIQKFSKFKKLFYSRTLSLHKNEATEAEAMMENKETYFKPEPCLNRMKSENFSSFKHQLEVPNEEDLVPQNMFKRFSINSNLDELEREGSLDSRTIQNNQQAKSPEQADESPGIKIAPDVDIDVGVEPKRINLKVWEYVLSFFYKPRSLREKKEVLENGIKNIDERLDVINILKKLRELDKLRALLLDHDQLVLFNNLPKPQIKAKNENHIQKKATLSHTLLKSKFIEGYTTEEQVLESYNSIKYKENKTEIDERLLQIFDGQN